MTDLALLALAMVPLGSVCGPLLGRLSTDGTRGDEAVRPCWV